jgi:hypothetical protein
MTYPTSNSNYSVATGANSTSPFITIIAPRAPTVNDGVAQGYQITQRWVDASASNREYFLLSYTSAGGYVQANWVLLASGSASTETLTGNSGGAVGVDAFNNINFIGAIGTGIDIVGSPGANTLTASLADIPNSSLANSSISLVAGTGITITTSPVSLGGTTTISSSNTGVVSTLTGNTGGPISPTLGNINVIGDGVTVAVSGTPGDSTLTITALATPTGFSSINFQTFSTSGTYTPSPGMVYTIIEAVGGGGGGGGGAATNASVAGGGGGGAGGYSRGAFSATTIGASQAITIGAAGTGATAGANTGGTGGNTTVGTLISANGGNGGLGSVASNLSCADGGLGANATGGSLNLHGQAGLTSFATYLSGIAAGFGGAGGNSLFGSGGSSQGTATTSNDAVTGANGFLYGAGGAGGVSLSAVGAASAVGGGNGSAGYVIITEYIS